MILGTMFMKNGFKDLEARSICPDALVRGVKRGGARGPCGRELHRVNRESIGSCSSFNR